MDKTKLNFASKAIHVGQEPDEKTGSVIVPLYQTSTYAQKSPGEHMGYEYSRTDNPTRHAYEQCLASLENANYCASFASGMAAIHCIVESLEKNVNIVCSDDVYGGTFRLFDKVFTKHGLKFSYLDFSNLNEVEEFFNKNKVDVSWIETPSNPMLKLIDIKKLSNLCKTHDVKLVVDNTFASPFIQNPLNLGADMVVHSTTKYIGGHSDVVGGAIMCNDANWFGKIKFLQNSIGAVPSAFDTWLSLRGVKTLALRMQRHCENASKISNFLKNHSKVNQVIYPGIEDHPNHGLVREQMQGYAGGMLSVYLDMNLNQTKAFLSHLKLFILAESLGGVESLIEHPAIMTHASLPAEKRKALGITDAFIRISVGIEDIEDLQNDLQYALSKV
ncbi:MAG TPA: PLP-dependent aspartate aminotransferase family protein [Oligoflexia bacterium]|nr:PLP-dependent aspartate aminotransferase family protein [Oligoflexia bacterium]HMR24888.1 PLP-dependent aspartate aminotransferase family protein [Oligoflexia bacterium]